MSNPTPGKVRVQTSGPRPTASEPWFKWVRRHREFPKTTVENMHDSSIHYVKLGIIILGYTPWTSVKSFNKRLETTAVIEIVGSPHLTPPRRLRKSVSRKVENSSKHGVANMSLNWCWQSICHCHMTQLNIKNH